MSVYYIYGGIQDNEQNSFLTTSKEIEYAWRNWGTREEPRAVHQIRTCMYIKSKPIQLKCRRKLKKYLAWTSSMALLALEFKVFGLSFYQ